MSFTDLFSPSLVGKSNYNLYAESINAVSGSISGTLNVQNIQVNGNATGISGATGATGAVGATGSKGSTGSTGSTGSAGASTSPNSLTYYEEFDYNIALVGCGISAPIQISINRIGRTVTISSLLDTSFVALSNGVLSLSSNFPPEFNPATNNFHFPLVVQINGVGTITDNLVTVFQNMSFTGNATGGDYIAGQSIKIWRFSVTYGL